MIKKLFSGPWYTYCNNSSAVAEMGDRLVTIDMGETIWSEKWGLLPLSEGELGPHLTQCRLDRGLSLYQVAP